MRYCINIKGRVQGVFFRKYVLEKANELGIFGYVENRSDGSVYCEAEGKGEFLELFIDWCGEGSPMSHVTSVEVEAKEPVHYSHFEIHM